MGLSFLGKTKGEGGGREQNRIKDQKEEAGMKETERRLRDGHHPVQFPKKGEKEMVRGVRRTRRGGEETWRGKRGKASKQFCVSEKTTK